MGDRRGAYRVFMRRYKGKRLFGKPVHRWENNIKMYLQNVRGGTWTRLIWLMTGRDDGLL
jgi:hypothetical protein